MKAREKMTITLQDMTVLLGLPTDGLVVTGRDNRDWSNECKRLLGRQPPQSAIRGWAVKLRWLHDEFTVVPTYLEDMEVDSLHGVYIAYVRYSFIFRYHHK